ncbi:hypothetical protein IAU59_000738 [Kwoniella sp. CBS 9459]
MSPTADDAQIQSQLDLLQLLTSMYTPDELTLSDPTQFLLDAYNEESDPKILSSLLSQITELEAELSLPLDEYDKDLSDEKVRFQILLPVGLSQRGSNSLAIRFKQPSWLSRSSYETMTGLQQPPSENEEASEYLLSTIETIREFLKAAHTLSKQEAQSNGSDKSKGRSEWAYDADTPIDRVWFWFPTLSTREKRDDLVNYGNEMGLTGFVLAGKPALLCVEGPGMIVDKYMSRIKSESWSDIPSNHKKVTERLRNRLASPTSRAFETMSEVTHLVPKYGQYNHRGDMSEVRRLMDSWGVGDDFGDVVMGGTGTGNGNGNGSGGGGGGGNGS